MYCTTTLLPLDVSFGNCQDAERPANPTNVSGYFQTMNIAPVHNPNGPSVPAPVPPEDNLNGYTWIYIREDNTEDVPDTIGTDPFWDNAGAGGFEWDIPMVYRVVGDTDNGVSFPAPNKVIQTENTDGNGNTTVVKGDAWQYRMTSGYESHSN